VAPPAVEAGADPVLAATVLHIGQLRVGDVKDAHAAPGVTLRRDGGRRSAQAAPAS
jgi:imidazole glycerol-phosphate synthase subunit HisF